MNLPESTRNYLKTRRWGMFSPDGNLRVGDVVVRRLEATNGTPEHIWELVEAIQDEVASDGDWCAEVYDTYVREEIQAQLEDIYAV